jgi:hypothetical protein
MLLECLQLLWIKGFQILKTWSTQEWWILFDDVFVFIVWSTRFSCKPCFCDENISHEKGVIKLLGTKLVFSPIGPPKIFTPQILDFALPTT